MPLLIASLPLALFLLGLRAAMGLYRRREPPAWTTSAAPTELVCVTLVSLLAMGWRSWRVGLRRSCGRETDRSTWARPPSLWWRRCCFGGGCPDLSRRGCRSRSWRAEGAQRCTDTGALLGRPVVAAPRERPQPARRASRSRISSSRTSWRGGGGALASALGSPCSIRRFSAFICLMMRNSANATITKLMMALTKLP